MDSLSREKEQNTIEAEKEKERVLSILKEMDKKGIGKKYAEFSFMSDEYINGFWKRNIENKFLLELFQYHEKMESWVFDYKWEVDRFLKNKMQNEINSLVTEIIMRIVGFYFSKDKLSDPSFWDSIGKDKKDEFLMNMLYIMSSLSIYRAFLFYHLMILEIPFFASEVKKRVNKDGELADSVMIMLRHRVELFEKINMFALLNQENFQKEVTKIRYKLKAYKKRGVIK